MAEPLACVVRGMEIAGLRGETVAVLGAGPIGLMFVRLCARAGARVIVAGRRAERLALAAELGASEVIDIDTVPDVVAAIWQRTEGNRGADKVIEAVGKAEAWEQAIAIARKGSVVSLSADPADTAVNVETHRIHYDEVTLKGSFHHTPATFRAALNLIASGKAPASRFIQQELAPPRFLKFYDPCSRAAP